MDKYVEVWGLEKQGNRWLANLSTKRKETWGKAVQEAKSKGDWVGTDNKGNEYVYVVSRWGKFCPMVGSASSKIDDILSMADTKPDGSFKKPVVIKVDPSRMEYTNESYQDKNGNMVWNNPKITVFDFELADGGNNSYQKANTGNPAPPSDEDSIPF